MVQIKSNRFKNVSIIASFKILNDVTLYTLLVLRNKIFNYETNYFNFK